MCCVLVCDGRRPVAGGTLTVTTEYRARAGGMRVRTTVGSSREASTQGPKFAKNLDNAEKLRKKIGILRHLPSESWNKTYINRKRRPN